MSQEFIILEGKDLNTLIEQGLKSLNKDRNQVEIEVLEKGKSLMGVLIKAYKIKMSLKQAVNEDVQDNKRLVKAEETLDTIINEMDRNDFFKISFLEDGVYLTIKNEEIFYSNIKQVLNKIRKKKISNIDTKAIEEALHSKEKTCFRIAPQQEEVLIDSELIIDISEDGLSGFIILIPPDGGKELKSDFALEKIKEVIKYGLDSNQVERVVNERIYNKRVLIAKGQPAIDGKDGYIKYFFSKKTDSTPHILEDGSADFRNLDLIQNVSEGDILAELIPPVEGRKGITVKGESIDCKNGKEVFFKYGKNVGLSEDGSMLIAEKDGQVILLDSKVVINDIFEVKGNVDNSTGNIKFNGAIRIKGNVLTGFEVDAVGNVEIEGVVEGAKIKSHGNVVLKRGIQGYNKGRIISKRAIAARYIENSYIDAENDVISEAIMHSEVISKGSIKVSGKKGLIVGGICKATTEIAAKTIGSTMATATILEVGLDPNLRTSQESIKNKVEETESNIDKLNKSIVLFNRLSKNGELTGEKEDMFKKTIQTRNILIEKLDNLRKELSSMELQIELLSKGKIKVENVIYPGVKIIIGNNVMFVRDEIKHCTVYRENNEIKIGPYEL